MQENKRATAIILCVVILVTFVVNGILIWQLLPRRAPVQTFGVYWQRGVTNNTWAGIGVDQCDVTLLDFAKANGVNEIYLNHGGNMYLAGNAWGTTGINNVVNPTRRFISAAHDRGIRVFMLFDSSGNILLEADSVIRNSRHRFNRQMVGLKAYQATVNEHERFAGIQFNVEPHQQRDPETGWYAQRAVWTQRKINFVQEIHDNYGNYFTIDWCIPAWWHSSYHEVIHRGVSGVPLYQAIMREGNRTFVMAFRNTAEAMVSFGREVLEFGNKIGQEVIMLAAVLADPYPHVYFARLGAEEMLYQLGRLESIVKNQIGNMRIGTAVHQIAQWYNWP